MDLRQETEHIFNNGYQWYEENLGEGVIWHEFDSENTEYHGTYDEGGRAYTAGILIPALWVIVTEDSSRPTDAGRKPTEKITAAFSMRSLHLSGVSDPEDYTRRLNDLMRYDNRMWKVGGYQIRGRVPSSIIVGVTGTEIYVDEEMVFDTLPDGMTHDGSIRPIPYPNDASPDFVFHDGPGEYDSLYIDFDEDIIIDGGTP